MTGKIPGRKVLCALAAAAAASVAAGGSVGAATTPRVEFDLRVAATGDKEASVTSAGDVVLLNLYATIFGADEDATNDGIQSAVGSFRSTTGGLLGDLLGLAPPAPFNAVGSDRGTQLDVDGDGDFDVTGTTATTGHYSFRASTPQSPQPANGWLVGQVRWTAKSVTAADTSINFALRAFPNPVMSARVDGESRSQLTTTVVFNAPVVIHGVPPGPQYLTGTIDTHVTATGTMLATPGAAVILARGADVPAGATLDLRDAGGAWGANELRVNDSTSGNAGGTLIVGGLHVGTTDTGQFVQSAGTTSLATAVVGAGGGAGGGTASTVQLSGGSITSSGTVTVGGASPGSFTQTGGLFTPDALRVGTSAAAAGSTLKIDGGTMNVAKDLRVATGNGGDAAFRHLSGNTTLAGPLVIGDGGHASLEFAGGQLLAPRAILAASGSANAVLTGGTIRTNSISPRLDITPDVPHAGSGAIPTANFTQRGGELNASTVNVGIGGHGSYIFEGGTLKSTWVRVHNGGAGSARLEIRGGTFNPVSLQVGSDGTRNTFPGTGTALQSGGHVSVHSVTVVTGSTYTLTGGNITMIGGHVGGVMDLSHAPTTITATGGWLSFLTPGSLLNAENATFIGGPKSLLQFPSGFDPLTQIGSIQTQGAVQVAGQPLTIPAGRSVGGEGTIDGNVSNAGLLAPGNSPGVLNINGSYAQAAGGTLEAEIAGAADGQFDVLHVSAAAALDGFLQVSLLDGFVPTASQSFTIVSGQGVSGTFDNVVNGRIEFPGGRFDVVYAPTSVTLTNFTAVPEPSGLAIAAIAAAAALARRSRRERA